MAIESQSVKKEKKEKKSKKGSSEVLEGSKEMVLNGGELSARGKGREILLRSIAGFLESNGFKKTLAIFHSEAQIEENSWKSPVVNLNDFVAKFSESSDVLAVPAIERNKPQDIEKETEKKTRKRSPKGTGEERTVDEKTALSKLVEEEQQQEKKEKRKKKSSEELKPVEEQKEVENQEEEDKKKKKYSYPSENDNVFAEEDDKKKEKEGKKKKMKEIEEVKKPHQMKEGANATYENEEKTVSKKRKKGEEENVESDGKKRKLEEANGSAKTAPVENMNGPKSGKKEMESAEPKSANAFKRVKIEEVKFADQRFQDNSYWAKDGADSGYGAKAQQILEQVRGRGFRHEKTKKKRGTYKGGQIDLQSHSIKFNYSDEE